MRKTTRAAVTAAIALALASCATSGGATSGSAAASDAAMKAYAECEARFKERYAAAPNPKVALSLGDAPFSLARSSFMEGIGFLEFVPAGETAEKHTRTITVVSVPAGVGLDDYLNSYLRTIEPLAEGEPVVYENDKPKYGRELVVEALLVDEGGDRVEHVLAKMFVGPDGGIVAIVLSTPLSLSKVVADPAIITRELAANRVAWLEKLVALYYLPF